MNIFFTFVCIYQYVLACIAVDMINDHNFSRLLQETITVIHEHHNTGKTSIITMESIRMKKQQHEKERNSIRGRVGASSKAAIPAGAKCIMRKDAKLSIYDKLYMQDLSPTPRTPHSKVLICENHKFTEKVAPDHHIYGDMMNHSFSQKCPHVIDYEGNRHQAPHMCISSTQPNICIFDIKNVIITVCGGLIAQDHLVPYNFYHPSFGSYQPSYNDVLHLQWQGYYIDNANPRILAGKDMNAFKIYDIVIPARMIWDQHFGHLTHQSIPYIAHAYEFLSHDIISKAYWHCSVFTAAILKLLDVPSERLLIQSMYQKRDKQEPIIAKQLIFPYVPGWLPPQLASLHGIANRISKQITNNLMKISCPNNMISSTNPSKRSILYLARTKGQTRYVVNEKEIIDMMYRYLNHDKYQFIIVNETKELKVIEELHCVWQQHAQFFHNATVIIGSHGSAFGNLFTSPDDVDYIEFNIFPDDPIHTVDNTTADFNRPSLLAGAWNKGGTGNFYVIEPYNRSRDDYYDEEIMVSSYELLLTLGLIEKNLLVMDKNGSPYKPVAHGFMPKKIKKKNSAKRAINPKYAMLKNEDVNKNMIF